ncbi:MULTISPECIES: hypothetical protein [unclassified Mesorhizobium]|nr:MULTISPECIES: hypothetical protein [unclassified Mesorhizobium]WJI80948.1 hypothetical protein NLY34_29870 [Mesorhizobium sp. C374B]WJI87486.1 hypothetical protein NLY42_00620 [Mesorhizobium sp. C372A]
MTFIDKRTRAATSLPSAKDPDGETRRRAWRNLLSDERRDRVDCPAVIGIIYSSSAAIRTWSTSHAVAARNGCTNIPLTAGATEEAKTPRMSDDLNPRPINGCIEYGHSGERTPAQFMGTARDDERNDEGDFCRHGATAKQVSSSDGELPPKGWTTKCAFSFPVILTIPHMGNFVSN